MSLRVWLPLVKDTQDQGTIPLPSPSYNTLTQQTDGKLGKCYSGQGIYHLENDFLSNEWSLCAWVKSASWASANDIILCKNTSASDNCQFYFSIINGAKLNFAVNAGSSGLTFNYTFATNTWYHVAATYDGTKYALYVNGEQKKTGALSTTLKTGMNNLGINCRSTNAAGTSQTGDGGKKLNDVRIYDHCLSAAEVKEIAQGLVLHYKLDGPRGGAGENILTNSSGYLGTTNWSGLVTVGTNEDTPYLIAKRTDTTSSSRTFCTHTAITSLVSDWTPGTTKFTISGYYKIPSSETYAVAANMFIRWGASSGTSDTGFSVATTSTKDIWTYFKKTFTVPSSYTSGQAVNFYLSAFSTGLATIYWKYIKLEIGENATAWTPTDNEMGDIDTTLVQDSSGYEHNGWNSNATLTSSSGRYSYATACNGATVDNSSNILTGAQYFFGNLSLTTPSALTVAWWGKNDAYGRGGIFETTATTFTATTGMNGTDYNTTAIANWDTTFRVYNGSSAFNFFSSFNKNGSWHHHGIVFDAIKAYYYCDGILVTSGALTGTLPSFNGIRMGLGRAGGAYRQIKETVSDLRIYCTALSATDIKQLYEVGAKVDNKQNLHTYEFNENDSNKLTKTGILKDYAIEPYKTLSDGSYWKLMLFHYVNNGSNLFTSSNATYNNGFGLYSRLRDIANYTYDSKYEYYVIQDGKEFRWTQTSSPTAASITGLTTVSGYTNPVNGLAKANQSNTYIGYRAWWGACGCWTSYSTGGKTGIPGFGSHDGNGICTTYLALYTRIEKPKAEIANENIYAENLIEF